ncbi:superoxide dismutase [Candidatus Nomurabacteria bacterium]|nr:superoxide dismutase [Candidatus Nomurabacteria bacterium]
MYTLPKLDYEYNALEPWIDEQTMRIHHTKHHQVYIDKLNAELEKNPDLKNKSLDDLCASEIPAVKNNAGGHWNHTFFWGILGSKESKSIKEKIDESFENFGNFQKLFKEAALGRFGSGWVWLTLGSAGKMEITSTANQDVPEGTVLLGLDVWEHAYYLRYQNRRAEYVDAFWNIVNWEKVWYIAQNGGIK